MVLRSIAVLLFLASCGDEPPEPAVPCFTPDQLWEIMCDGAHTQVRIYGEEGHDCVLEVVER